MALPPSAAATPAPAPAESTKQLLLKIDGQAADLKALRGDVDELRNQLRAALDERDQLRYLLERQDRRANEAEHKLKGMRAQLRRASRAKPAMTPEEAPQFADAEQGFRYLVLTRWAVRTPVSEQGQRPLPDFRIGPQFLDSLAQLEGIKPEKVADVVVEIVMGRAQELTGREVHRLRTGPGGKDPVRTRPDGAVAYRASLQVKTPSARRIHYWQCADGVVELARVATHDDFEA